MEFSSKISNYGILSVLMFLCKSTTLSKNHRSRWLQLCVKLFPAFIQIFVVKKSLFISVSSAFYEKYIVIIFVSIPTILSVLWKIVSSTYFWLVHLSIKFYNDWVIFISHAKLSIVFTLCTNTDFIRMFFHQLAKFSINLTKLFIIIWNEKEQKKCQVLQRKDCYAKK